MSASSSAVESVVAQFVSELQAEGLQRQLRSAHDQVAEAMLSIADQLAKRVEAAAADDDELTPAEFGALHGKSASQVRRWCQQKRLEHRRVGRDYRIRRGATIPAGVESAAA